jgi:choline-sulfatase
VPFIFSLPEQRRALRPSRTCATPVGLIDLFPTLCALSGAEPPPDLAGVDLAPVLRGEGTPPERPIYCDALTPRWGEGTEFRMVRWQHYKYVRFRDAPPLFFDLARDPREQYNLIERGVRGAARAALEQMARLANQTMDFDAAERERLERDGALKTDYAQDLPPSTGNLYLLPSGRLVNADDVLYNPTVIAETPEQAFDDAPSEVGKAETP